MSSPSADAVNARIDGFANGVIVSDAGATTATAMPAGGTGATEGAWDTAANRNLAIAAHNNLRLDHDALYAQFNSLMAVLRTNRIIPQ